MIEWILRRRTGFLLLTILAASCGVFLAFRLPVLMYPKTQRSQVGVRVEHAGMSALDFQKAYASRIESGLAAVEGLELLSSVYSSDSSSFDLLFDWKVKSKDAKAAVESAMAGVNALLPEGIKDAWQVRYREGENAGFLVLGVVSNSVNPEKLYGMLKGGVEPELAKLNDAEDVSIYNVEELRADVTLKQEVMLSYGITVNDVNQALQSGFSLTPLGRMREGDQRYTVRHLKKSGDLDSLYRLEVKRAGSSSVSLDDIADISIRYTVPRQVFLVGARPAVQLTATPVEGGNLTRLSSQLLGIMEGSKKSGRLPADSEFVFYIDPAKYINRSIENVSQSALLGGVLAILIVFIILGEMRNTMIIGLSIPLSILFTFIPMYFFGMSLNLISLGGLALAVGMIVDATIVVTENIHRWRFEAAAPLTAPEWSQIVARATAEVRMPVISSTLTSVLVFLPISFTAPLANAILGDQARTVVFSLLASMLVSLTIVPLIAWIAYRSPRQLARAHEPPRGLGWLSVKSMNAFIAFYRRALDALIRKKAVALGFLVAVFSVLALCVIFLLPSIPKELLSTPKSDRIVLFFRKEGVSDTVEVMEQIVPGILARIDSSLGKLSVRTFMSVRGQFSQAFIDLNDASKSDQAQKLLEKEFVTEGDWYFNIQPWDPAALPLPMSNSLQVSVFGPDAATKVELLDSMQRILNRSGLYRRTFTRPSAAVTNEFIMESRAETIGGISPWNESNLLSLTRRALSGTSSTTLTEGLTEISVSARYPEDLLNTREKLENFLVPLKNSFVPLKHFFDFRTEKGISQIYAENGELVYRLYANLGPGSTDAQMAKARADAKVILENELKPPDGYSWSFDNSRQDMDGALSSLFIALAVSIFLMYVLLAWQFDSLITPLIILVTIPLGLIGVLICLKLFGSVLNLNSLLGTILLGGIVVNNAIIMIDFYENARDKRADPYEALLSAASLRFQPILITTLTTIIGMLPLAIGMGGGSDILKPLGIAVSGGLTVSTLLALFAVPALIRLRMKDGVKRPAKREKT